MKSVTQATWIKFFAMLTAIPRWAGALLAAEGFDIPDAWLGAWIPASALLAMGMAITEAWAFSYIFTAWRNQHDKRANRLFSMAMASAAIFVFVLAPYIKARVTGVEIREVLSNPIVAWIWAIAIAASTISIIVTVGYAQKAPKTTKSDKSSKAPVVALDPCWCGQAIGSTQARSAHSRKHKNELADFTSIPQALNRLSELYPGSSVKPADVRKLIQRNAKNVQVDNEL